MIASVCWLGHEEWSSWSRLYQHNHAMYRDTCTQGRAAPAGRRSHSEVRVVNLHVYRYDPVLRMIIIVEMIVREGVRELNIA